MPYTCDPANNHCRLELPTETTSGVTGWTTTGTYVCPDATTRRIGYFQKTFCGRSRRLYVDPDNSCRGNRTWYSEVYLEWLFSAAADTIYLNNETNTSTDITKLDANRNGTHYVNGQPFALYKRARITAAKEVARDVIYQINSNCAEGQGFPCPSGGKDVVRFGIGRFDGAGSSPGGFVSSPIGNYSANATALDAAIQALDAETSTPLGETLFKIYTYFMSRTAASRPFGVVNGNPAVASATRFPAYAYRTSDGATAARSRPTRCRARPRTRVLVPEELRHHADGRLPDERRLRDLGVGRQQHRGPHARLRRLRAAPDRQLQQRRRDRGRSAAGGRALYLDDIAKFMHERDFRPDIANVNGVAQTIDIYTVGFATDADANALLSKTATVGSGLFFTSTQAQELTDALVGRDPLDHREVAVLHGRDGAGDAHLRSAASSTPPSSCPVLRQRLLGGHLLSWQITEDGEILDSNGNCAFEGNPAPCKSGRFSHDRGAVLGRRRGGPGARGARRLPLHVAHRRQDADAARLQRREHHRRRTWASRSRTGSPTRTSRRRSTR